MKDSEKNKINKNKKLLNGHQMCGPSLLANYALELVCLCKLIKRTAFKFFIPINLPTKKADFNMSYYILCGM